jgi:hypothetical protein
MGFYPLNCRWAFRGFKISGPLWLCLIVAFPVANPIIGQTNGKTPPFKRANHLQTIETIGESLRALSVK